MLPQAPTPSKRSKPPAWAWRSLPILLAISLLLSGCLLNRILTFKDQFCEFEANFALQLDEETQLTMHRPVLLDSDVIWLAGAAPTERIEGGDNLRVTYVLERDISDAIPDYNLSSQAGFIKRRGKYRLQEGRLDRNLTALLGAILIRKAFTEACALNPNIPGRKVEIDLGEVDRSTLLSRRHVNALLGPAEELDNEGAAVYRYRLRGETKTAAHLRIWFDADEQLVQRFRFRYLRFEVDADLLKGEASIKFRL